MNNPITQSELTQILGEIREGFRDVNDRLNQLEKTQTEIKAEIKQDITDVKGDIKGLSEKVSGIDTRLSNLEASVQKIPDLSEKIGELKNWKQIGLVVITALISAISTGTIGGFIGWFRRSLTSLKPSLISPKICVSSDCVIGLFIYLYSS